MNDATTTIHSSSYPKYASFLADVAASASSWRRISISECFEIYDNLAESLTAHRHAVMVVHTHGETHTAGWIESEIVTWTGLAEAGINSLWTVASFPRTDYFLSQRRIQQERLSADMFQLWESFRRMGYVLRLDQTTGLITPDNSTFSMPPLVADYCLAEPFVVPCELNVQNLMLLIVCAFCLLKAVICLVTMIWYRHQDPLITVGDAIESFIAAPDSTTDDMCWLSRRPGGFREQWLTRRAWPRGPRQWKKLRHRLGSALSWKIWTFSYFCILFMLGMAVQVIWVNRHSRPW
jgi:hypothetical protein